MRTNLYLLAGDQMLSMNETPFEKEKDLQLLIAQNPKLLLREPTNENEVLYLIQREFAIHGLSDGSSELSLDHLFIDQNGVPILVEVKRSTNTQIRREVVGQMLDYASRLKLCSVEDLKKCASDDMIPESLWAQVEKNLSEEHFRLIFAADHIPDSLSVIMDFLNRHFSNVEVYGVEICQHHTKNGDTLVTSNIVESDHTVEQRVGSSQTPWTEEAFIQELKQHNAIQSVNIFNTLRDFFSRKGFTLEYAPFSQNGLAHVFKGSIKICGINSWDIGPQHELKTFVEFGIATLPRKIGISKEAFMEQLLQVSANVHGGDTYQKIDFPDLADEEVMGRFQNFLLYIGSHIS